MSTSSRQRSSAQPKRQEASHLGTAASPVRVSGETASLSADELLRVPLLPAQRQQAAVSLAQRNGNAYLQGALAAERLASARAIQRFGETQHGEIESEAVSEQFTGPEFEAEQQQVSLGNWETDFNQISEANRYLEEYLGAGLDAETTLALAQIMAEVRYGPEIAGQMTVERFGEYRAAQHFDNPLAPGAQLAQPAQEGGTGEAAVPFYIGSSVEQIRTMFCEALREGPTPVGRELLGSGLHTMQDLFAHTNYVEIALRVSGVEEMGGHEVETLGGTVERGDEAGMYRMVSGTFGQLDTAVSILHMIAESLAEPSAPGGELTTGDRITIVLLRRFNSTLASVYERYLNWMSATQESVLNRVLGERLRSAAREAKDWLSARIARVIDGINRVLTLGTTLGTQPSHSEINKDSPQHPLYGVAHALAVHASRELTRLVLEAWSSGDEAAGELAIQGAIDLYTAHPQQSDWWRPVVAGAAGIEEVEIPQGVGTAAPEAEAPQAETPETVAPETEAPRTAAPEAERPARPRVATPRAAPRRRTAVTVEDLRTGRGQLRRGHRGEAVRQLQQALIDAGFPLPDHDVDGIFGEETERVLRAFQRARGNPVTGIVDQATWEALAGPHPEAPAPGQVAGPAEQEAMPVTAVPGTAAPESAAATALPQAQLRPRSRGRAYMLDWDAVHTQINQRGTLREAFAENLRIQLERIFGEPVTRDQVLERIREAQAAGQEAEARRLRANLFIANEYAVVETLDVEHSERYRRTPEDTFCNIYAYDVVTAMGGYLPRVWWTSQAIARLRAGEQVEAVYGRTVHEMNANALTDWMHAYGREFGWRPASDINAAQEAANNGMLVVLLAAHTPDPRTGAARAGHVNVIMPETEGHAARRDEEGMVTHPLQTQAGGTNFSYRPHSSQWWQARGYRGGGAWIAEGTPTSPLLTPEQLGGGRAPAAAPVQGAEPRAEERPAVASEAREAPAATAVGSRTAAGQEGAFEYALRTTGQFESGGNYGALQTVDIGVVSYGRYQVTLTSGNLYRVLQSWVADGNSEAEGPEARRVIAARLGVGERGFNGNRGLARDQEFLQALRQAGRSASMAHIQDEYERVHFFEPAAQRARSQGVQSNIGIAIFFDTRNQSPAGLSFCLRALEGVRADEIGERAYLHQFLDARTRYLQSVAERQRQRAVEARRAGDEAQATRLERTAAMLERAPERRIRPFRQRVDQELAAE